MLVLTRRLGEEIVIGDNVRVTVVAVKGDQVRLGVTAPKSVDIDRKEIHDRRAEFAAEVGGSDPSCAIPHREKDARLAHPSLIVEAVPSAPGECVG